MIKIVISPNTVPHPASVLLPGVLCHVGRETSLEWPIWDPDDVLQIVICRETFPTVLPAGMKRIHIGKYGV